MVKQAISYSRISSKKQKDGHGLSRQDESAQAVCLQFSWKLIARWSDNGVSSFRGKNLFGKKKDGSFASPLGQFIQDAKAGKYQKGTVLILDDFSRFSRYEDKDTVEHLFCELLKTGIDVFNCATSHTYSHERMLNNWMSEKIILIAEIEVAVNHSKEISRKVCKQRADKYARALRGEPVNLCEFIPNYYRFDKETKTWHKTDKARLVTRLYREYTKGESLGGIARKLNLEGVPTINSTPERPHRWQAQTVRDTLLSRYPLGEYKGIRNYFPPIVDETDWNTIQALLSRNESRKGHKSSVINIFKGVVRCSECGEPVVMQNINGGKGGSYYRCNGKSRGTCTQPFSIRVDRLEQWLFGAVLKETPQSFLGKQNKTLQNEINKLQIELKDVNEQLDTASIQFIKSKGSETVRLFVDSLSTRKDTLEAELKEKKMELMTAKGSPDAFNKLKGIMVDSLDEDERNRGICASLKDTTIRQQLASVVPNVLKTIRIDFRKGDFDLETINGQVTKNCCRVISLFD